MQLYGIALIFRAGFLAPKTNSFSTSASPVAEAFNPSISERRSTMTLPFPHRLSLRREPVLPTSGKISRKSLSISEAASWARDPIFHTTVAWPGASA